MDHNYTIKLLVSEEDIEKLALHFSALSFDTNSMLPSKAASVRADVESKQYKALKRHASDPVENVYNQEINEAAFKKSRRCRFSPY